MPFYNKTRKVWIGRVRLKDVKKQKVFEKKSDAKAWEAETRKLILRERQTDIIYLIDFANKYLDYSKEKFVRKTYNEKKYAFKALLTSIDGKTPVHEITRSLALTHLRNENKSRSGNATNKDRKNLVAGWHWAVKYIDGFPQDNPFKVEKFSEKRHPRYVPSKEEFKRVLDHAESSQDRYMLTCYLYLGARKSELFNLKWSDISWTDKKLRLKTMKRKDGISEYNWLPMTEELVGHLADHKVECGDREYVFENPRTNRPYQERNRWFPRLCKKANVHPFGVHSVRHLTASILVEHDIPLIDIQTILRHKSITTTEKYLHRLKSVRKAVDVLKI